MESVGRGTTKMPQFCLQLAGLSVSVASQYSQVEHMCSGYEVPKGASSDIDVRIDPQDIDAERDEGAWSDAYLETLAVYRQIAEALPAFDRMLVHGALLSFQGEGYLFAAPSGTGKSTHALLWKRFLGDAVSIVNGDKPIIHVPGKDDPPVAYGTPWAGKEGWHENVSVPLRAVCFLRQAPTNSIELLDASSCVDRLLRQAYLPFNSRAAGRTLELLDGLIGRVPLYELACDISRDAVRCSFEALSGRRFSEWDASSTCSDVDQARTERRIKDGFVLRDVAGQTVVIATGEASRDFHGMVKLNGTGRVIWEGLSRGDDAEDIAQELAKSYDVDLETAQRDVASFVATAQKAGFLA